MKLCGQFQITFWNQLFSLHSILYHFVSFKNIFLLKLYIIDTYLTLMIPHDTQLFQTEEDKHNLNIMLQIAFYSIFVQLGLNETDKIKSSSTLKTDILAS